MKLSIKKIFLFLLLLNTSLYATESINSFTRYILSNGFTVYINEDSEQSKVLGAVVVKAGSKHDPLDSTGIAHYLEHMLFKGTANLGTTDYSLEKPYLDRISALYERLAWTFTETQKQSIINEINQLSIEASRYAIPNEFDRLSQLIGATNTNAYTSQEETVYYSYFPADELLRWSELYSERFITPVFRLFQSELEVVYEEKNMYLDRWQSVFFKEFKSNFWKRHPYGQTDQIGSTEHLRRPSLRRMERFYNDYYTANNMALILTGNIKAEEVLPIIEEKFGRLRRGYNPQFPSFLYNEAPFRGREFHEIAVSPIEVGMIGYRVPPFNPSNIREYFATWVAIKLLNNSGNTGLFDKLKLNGDILEADTFIDSYTDQGMLGIFIAPLINRQSLEDAENLIYREIAKIKNGEITDTAFNAVINDEILRLESSNESQWDKTSEVIDSFIWGYDYNQFAGESNSVLKTLTIEDIKAAANKCFTENRIVLYSRTGEPHNEKLVKPGFSPVTQNDSLSSYAEWFSTLPQNEPEPVFIDFNNDFKRVNIGNNTLFYINNPVNNISRISINYGIGKYENNMLEHLAYYLNRCGTATRSAEELKEFAFSSGVSYEFTAGRNYFTVSITALDENIAKGINIVNEIINSPSLDDNIIELLYNDAEAEREMELKNNDTLSDIVRYYLIVGEKSPYINRLTLDEISELTPSDILSALPDVLKYRSSIHYSGNIPIENITSAITTNYRFTPAPVEMRPLWSFQRSVYNQPTILLINNPDAAQSRIHFFLEGESYAQTDDPVIDSFNEYFGSGMSSIVFQEIRELRSLAYSTYSYYYRPPARNLNGYLGGYIGTQNDKTIEAITTFIDLLKNMPQKPERIPFITEGLIRNAMNDRPGFRSVTTWAEDQLRYGYNDDPNRINQPFYRNITMAEINSFYQKIIADKSINIGLLIDKNNIDIEALRAFGMIREIESSDIVRQ